MAKKVKPPAQEASQEEIGAILPTVQGHDQQIEALVEAVVKGRLPQALLFVGPSGIGKKRVALGVAQLLVCEKRSASGKKACGECGPCIRVAKQASEDLLVIEPQGASIKIEQAHDVLHFISLRRLGKARVIIINEAHLLGPQAGNALLKSLEEPPPETHFILVTSNSGAILTTIRSRSQTIRFQSLSHEVLKKLTKVDDWIIRSSQGSLEAVRQLSANADEWDSLRRTAISYLSSLVNSQSRNEEDFREAIKDRASALFVVQTWLRALRDFSVVSLNNGNVDKARLLLPDQQNLIKDGAKIDPRFLEQLVGLCLELEQDINRNVDRTLAFENFAIATAHAYSGREPRPVLSF